MSRVFCVFLLFCLFSFPLHATGVGQVTVQGNAVVAEIDILGIFTGQLLITFEQVMGLNQSALDITAVQIDPTDPALLSRFTDPSSISPPAQFPVLISVTPSAGSGLSFSGVVTVELSTTDLVFNPAYRLFKSPAGGAFHDITNFSGIGSYRVRGASGEFSDFIVAADFIPANQVVSEKFDRLQGMLDNYETQIASGVFSSLQSKLTSARQSWDAGLPLQAEADLESFSAEVKTNQGSNIPDLYRANDPNTVNVAGALRSGASTLIFSIRVS